MTTLPSAFAYAGIPYQVFDDNSGAVAVTVTCMRSASARSAGAISAMLSRTACRPSAFLAPLLPSARSSAALLHRGTLLGAEAAGLGLGILREHSRDSFLGAPGLGVMPAFHRKAGPGHTVALLD